MPVVDTSAATSRRKKRETAPETVDTLTPDRESVPLDVMMGNGKIIDLYGHKFEIAPFKLKVLGQVQELMNRLPMSVLAYAITEGDDTAEMARHFNRMRDVEEGTPGAISEDLAQMQIDTAFMQIPEGSEDVLMSTIVLAIQRKHPDFTEEAAEDLVDSTNILPLMRLIFQVNKTIKQRF